MDVHIADCIRRTAVWASFYVIVASASLLRRHKGEGVGILPFAKSLRQEVWTLYPTRAQNTGLQLQLRYDGRHIVMGLKVIT
jgi:hypothetical protein